MREARARLRLFDDESKYLDRFGLLLTVTVIATITLSLVDVGDVRKDVATAAAQFTVSLFVGLTLLLAVHASGVRRRYQWIANVGVGAGVGGSAILVLVALFGDTANAAAGTRVIWIVLSLFAPVLVIRRIVRHDRATAKTLLGAVSAYLLIALAFNFAYLAINAFGAPYFGSEEPTTSFMYFSLVTITTLGYGDLAAAEPFGRLLATFEAVIGQVYLVTFVAMIVGLMVEQRPQRNPESSD